MKNPTVQSPKRRRTRTQVTSLVQLYYASGQTQQAFCREHSLSASSLCTWLSRERSNSEEFVRASLPEVQDEGAHILFQDGLELHLPRSWGTAQLVALLNQLQGKGQSC